MSRTTSPTQAKNGDDPGITPHTPAPPMSSPDDDNSASALIDVPGKTPRDRLERHDFSDGGGSGGAEAFRRKQK
jgi:hypothetical protein